MASIKFKGKLQTMYYPDDTKAYDYIKIPELSTSHCNMNEFRQHDKYGPYANSDLFKSMLRKIKSNIFGNSPYLKLNAIPEGVNVDTSGFLAIVSIEV